MLNRYLPACLLPFWFVCNMVTAAPKCPPQPVKLGFMELGIYFKSERGIAAGNGIDRDLVDELSKRSGCAFDAKVQPRARTWIELKADRIDMMTATLSTPEREELLWLFPYVRSHHIVLLGPSAPTGLRTLEQFQAARSLKFGVIRGFAHSAFYDPLIAAWTQEGWVKVYADEAHLINALILGEVAAVTSYPGVFQFYINARVNPNSVRMEDWHKSNLQVLGNFGISKARFSQAEAHEWGMLIKAMQQDGTLLKIYRKYVSAHEAQNMLP